jgi:hypothetical protein
MLIRPTEDSGFACVFAEKMRLTASACASHRDGLVLGQLQVGSLDRKSLHVVAVPTAFAIVHTVDGQ